MTGSLASSTCYNQVMQNQAIATSIQALTRDFQRLDQSAQRISQAGQNDQVDLIQERVEQLHVRRDAQAQVKVLRTEDEMLGLILDLRV